MPKLIFQHGLSELDLFEANSRGYLSHVFVELADGRHYGVIFYDHVRLGQDLEEETNQGRQFIADPGMIVVNEITLESMQAAVDRLETEGFFEHFVAVNK